MAEIIDLTIDEPIIATGPATATNPFTAATRRPRAPPKCGYCGIQGHTVRSCNDPESMNTLRELRQRVGRYPPFQEIINWLQTIELRRLQFILSKYTYTSYKKSSREMCIDILSVVISDQYRMEERRILSALQTILQRGDMFMWVPEIDNIPQLYIRHCLHFSENEPTEEECQLVCHIIYTRNIPPNTQNHMIKKIHNFIMYIFRRYALERRNTRYSGQIHAGTNATQDTIKYVITKKTITEPVQIDCPICMDTKETPNILTTTCGHQFCNDCIVSLVTKKSADRCNCPLCRTPIHKLICETIDL